MSAQLWENDHNDDPLPDVLAAREAVKKAAAAECEAYLAWMAALAIARDRATALRAARRAAHEADQAFRQACQNL